MYPGGHAGAHRHFPSTRQTRHKVWVCLCIPAAEAAAGHCWQQEPAGCAGQDLGSTPQQMLECAIQVANADKLNSSHLAQGILCPTSLLQCALLSRAQAPLLNPLLVFYSVCLFWVLLPGTCQHESGGTRPHFRHGAQLAALVNLDLGLLCPSARRTFVVGSILRFHLWPVVSGSSFENNKENKESKAHFSLKKPHKCIYSKWPKKGKIKPIFYMNKADGTPSRGAGGDFPWRMSRCSCTHFVPSACCTEHIACNLERRGPSCSSSGTAACLDEKLRLWCIFILYIFVYINYIAMLWTQILLYLLVSVSYKKKKKGP